MSRKLPNAHARIQWVSTWIEGEQSYDKVHQDFGSAKAMADDAAQRGFDGKVKIRMDTVVYQVGPRELVSETAS